jgi:4-aminobutyrate aminotransferase-like enzyme
MEETKKRGLLIGRGGLVGNIVRISPPLNINRNDVEKALEILDDALSVMTN